MRYSVKALRQGREVVALELEATTPEAAAQAAQAHGYTVLSISSPVTWSTIALLRKNDFDLVLFSRELLALLNAGLNVVEAMGALTGEATENRNVLERVRQTLNEGGTLADALAAHPQYFPALYIATVRASQHTGDLARALERFLAYRERLDVARRKLVSAALYPLVLLGVGTAVVLFLLLYVIPRFARVYAEISTELPFFSRVLLHLGQTVDRYAVPVSIVSAGLIGWAIFVLAHPQRRAALFLRLPRPAWLENKLYLLELARLYRTWGMLITSGIPAVGACDMAGAILSARGRARLSAARTMIAEGLPISTAAARAGLVTPVATSLLAVGERSGNMGEMMEQLAAFYDTHLGDWIDRATRLFEPLVMLVIGLVIGLVVVLMYMPIFELAGAIR